MLAFTAFFLIVFEGNKGARRKPALVCLAISILGGLAFWWGLNDLLKM
jgi:formate hydrogenlyase subunit 3/multisubunit Na+/H+ antiporter MnhD subunit